MKHTKQNIVKLLKEKSDLSYKMAVMYKEDGREDLYLKYLHDSMSYDDAISIITKKDYFDSMCEIFKLKEDAE